MASRNHMSQVLQVGTGQVMQKDFKNNKIWTWALHWYSKCKSYWTNL